MSGKRSLAGLASITIILWLFSAFLLFAMGIIRDNYGISGSVNFVVDRGAWICFFIMPIVLMVLYFFCKNYDSIMKIKVLGGGMYLGLLMVQLYGVYIAAATIYYYQTNGYLENLVKLL